jgi:hypothetical protein
MSYFWKKLAGRGTPDAEPVILARNQSWLAYQRAGGTLAMLHPPGSGLHPELRRGMTTQAVGELRSRLGLPVVNVFDEMVFEAVRYLQSSVGLPDTGVVNQETWRVVLAPVIEDFLRPAAPGSHQAAPVGNAAPPISVCAGEANTIVFCHNEDDENNIGIPAIYAAANVMRMAFAPAIGNLRRLYNLGKLNIISERIRLIEEATGVRLGDTPTPSEIERAFQAISNEATRAREMVRIGDTISRMRHDLSLQVRATGSAMLRRAAELLDSVRGNRGRPSYDSLKAPRRYTWRHRLRGIRGQVGADGVRYVPGKTDAQIIASATRTNPHVNAAQGRLQFASRGLMVAGLGYSVYLVVNADPNERSEVVAQEVEGHLGGFLGGAAVGAAYTAFGVATGGVGFVVLVIAGSLAGGYAAQRVNLLQLLDIGPHYESERDCVLYYMEGTFEPFDIGLTYLGGTRVRRSQAHLFWGTGQVSGSMVGGSGHYRRLQVEPATIGARDLLGIAAGQYSPKWVDERLLHVAESEDLIRAGEHDARHR